jgi:hypothetical protein
MRHYIPEDGTLHNHCCENLKPKKNTLFLSLWGWPVYVLNIVLLGTKTYDI